MPSHKPSSISPIPTDIEPQVQLSPQDPSSSSSASGSASPSRPYDPKAISYYEYLERTVTHAPYKRFAEGMDARFVRLNRLYLDPASKQYDPTYIQRIIHSKIAFRSYGILLLYTFFIGYIKNKNYSGELRVQYCHMLRAALAKVNKDDIDILSEKEGGAEATSSSAEPSTELKKIKLFYENLCKRANKLPSEVEARAEIHVSKKAHPGTRQPGASSSTGSTSPRARSASA